MAVPERSSSSRQGRAGGRSFETAALVIFVLTSVKRLRFGSGPRLARAVSVTGVYAKSSHSSPSLPATFFKDSSLIFAPASDKLRRLWLGSKKRKSSSVTVRNSRKSRSKSTDARLGKVVN